MKQKKNTVQSTLQALQTMFQRAGRARVTGFNLNILSDEGYVLGVDLKLFFESGWIPEEEVDEYLDDREMKLVAESIDASMEEEGEFPDGEEDIRKEERLLH
jgi:hypothetical protein